MDLRGLWEWLINLSMRIQFLVSFMMKTMSGSPHVEFYLNCTTSVIQLRHPGVHKPWGVKSYN